MGNRLGVRTLACLSLALVACQPMYGGKPEKLVAPGHRKKAPDADAPAPKVYVDDCNADFRGDPKAVHPQAAIARQLVDTGDNAISSADKAKDDQAKVSLLKEGIEKYRNALIKDPFNVDATLKLAVAYDRVLRKGCALAMLKRLAALSANPKWASEANRNIDAIDANGQWFKDYRKDAMAAVGR